MCVDKVDQLLLNATADNWPSSNREKREMSARKDDDAEGLWRWAEGPWRTMCCMSALFPFTIFK